MKMHTTAALLLASSACAIGHGATRNPWDVPPAEGAVRLVVTNNFDGPMEIYAVGSGTTYRVGTVLPGIAGQFVLRPGMIGNGPVEFLARGTRKLPVRSDRLLLVPGDVVDFDIAINPVNSIATVRRSRP